MVSGTLAHWLVGQGMMSWRWWGGSSPRIVANTGEATSSCLADTWIIQILHLWSIEMASSWITRPSFLICQWWRAIDPNYWGGYCARDRSTLITMSETQLGLLKADCWMFPQQVLWNWLDVWKVWEKSNDVTEIEVVISVHSVFVF